MPDDEDSEQSVDDQSSSQQTTEVQNPDQQTVDDQSASPATESDQETSQDQVTDASAGQTTDDQSASQETGSDQQTSQDQVADETAEQTTEDQNTNQATQSTTQKISIAYDVELIPQPTTVSCWAAALGMVISCRDQASYTVEDVASLANMNTAKGYGWKEIHTAVLAWELKEEGPVSAMPDYWAKLLESCGPLWIVEVGAPAHAVVVVGMHGDGTPEETKVTLNNPWPPNKGAIEEKTFLAFDNEFGLAARANAMIVHK
jgi:hypothetical protein